MNLFYTYILFSTKLNQFHIGSTQDLGSRLCYHNNCRSKHTSRGILWNIVYSTEHTSRTDAIRLEIVIKKRGAARYLHDHDFIIGN